ncbi:putative membrane protein [Streptococcus rupicaprae]|uniref:Membrane protein n=2 Tax=Streptococcus rupicaprae TaxID=759619 RepID=A0ABV2FFZ0_9STRE
MYLMSKERLIAFTDAVLAIIMTILVLELERPDQISWQALWDLRTNFFAYTISFFWLGTMWVNLHRSWDVIDKINTNLVWSSIVLLFFSSFFPYTTALVSADFNNPVAQTLYGLIVLLVTASNVWMYRELELLNPAISKDQGFNILDRAGMLDIALKVIGLLLSLTIYPPAMMWVVLITAMVIVIPRSI